MLSNGYNVLLMYWRCLHIVELKQNDLHYREQLCRHALHQRTRTSAIEWQWVISNGLLQKEQTALSEHVIYWWGVGLKGVHTDSNLSNLKS